MIWLKYVTGIFFLFYLIFFYFLVTNYKDILPFLILLFLLFILYNYFQNHLFIIISIIALKYWVDEITDTGYTKHPRWEYNWYHRGKLGLKGNWGKIYYTKTETLWRKNAHGYYPGYFSNKDKELMFNFDYFLSSIDSPDCNSLNFINEYIENELKKVRSVLKHGFIYTDDLMDSEAYPVISELVILILQNKINNKPNMTEEELVSFRLEEYNKKLDKLERASVKTKSEIFKQVYYLLCLNYWTITRILLNEINVRNYLEDSSFKNSDSYVKLSHLNITLTKLLPNSIKRHLHNKSICLTNNVYAGFDTEYKYLEGFKNKLLSVQVSVNGCYTLKIPTLMNQHVFGSLDVSTNKFYETKPTSTLINYSLINTLIQEAITFNFDLKHDYKDFITKFTTLLINKGVKYYIKDNFYYFKTPSSNIITKFIEVKNDYSMKDLFETIIELDKKDNIKSVLFNKVLKLTDINSNTFSDTFSDIVFDYIELKTDTVYDTIFNSEISENTIENGNTIRKSRKFKGLKFNRFSIFTNNIIYLTAHYNAADLSMLKDFNFYKQYLNIVNKSFVVINRPIPFKHDGKTWNLKFQILFYYHHQVLLH